MRFDTFRTSSAEREIELTVTFAVDRRGIPGSVSSRLRSCCGRSSTLEVLEISRNLSHLEVPSGNDVTSAAGDENAQSSV